MTLFMSYILIGSCLYITHSLPEVLRTAFESQDVAQLQQAIASMDPAEAKYHMKRCVDSGLWVARDGGDFEGDDDDEVEDEGGSAESPGVAKDDK